MAGDDGVAPGPFLLHLEVVGAVADEGVELLEGAGVEQLLDPLAGGHLALRVLLLDRLLGGGVDRRLAQLAQVGELLLVGDRVSSRASGAATSSMERGGQALPNGCFCGSARWSRRRSRSASLEPGSVARRGSRPGCRSPSRPSSPRRPRPPRPAPPARARDFISVLDTSIMRAASTARPRSSPLRIAIDSRRGAMPAPTTAGPCHGDFGGAVGLEEGAALVFAEDVAHRAADLADRGVGGERGADRVQEVALAAGDVAQATPASPSTSAWSRASLKAFSRASWRCSDSGSTLRMSTSSTWSVTNLLTPTMMSWPLL